MTSLTTFRKSSRNAGLSVRDSNPTCASDVQLAQSASICKRLNTSNTSQLGTGDSISRNGTQIQEGLRTRHYACYQAAGIRTQCAAACLRRRHDLCTDIQMFTKTDKHDVKLCLQLINQKKTSIRTQCLTTTTFVSIILLLKCLMFLLINEPFRDVVKVKTLYKTLTDISVLRLRCSRFATKN
jgi:hypothetical protein